MLVNRKAGFPRVPVPIADRIFKRFGREEGFTLIELLVVIAIIAILAAILFPVFARAREKARTASCASNLKQIALAALGYCQDYDETFPTVPDQWPNPPFQYLPVDVLNPYIKNVQVWICPSRYYTITRAEPDGTGGWKSPLTDRLGYGWNWKLADQGWRGGATLATLERPVETMLAGDAQNIDICWELRRMAFANICGWNTYCGAPLGSQWEIPDNARHSGGENIAYADGHVKWQTSSAIMQAGIANGWTACCLPFWGGTGNHCPGL